MPLEGFESATPVTEQPHAYALHRMVKGISLFSISLGNVIAQSTAI
jgi:hypothetical protein